MNSGTKSGNYDAVILGCGILGLSIATELQKKGLKIALVGKDLPEDIDSTGFASPWAGANWHSFATDPKEEKRDVYTYKEFLKLSKTNPDFCERRSHIGYFNGKLEHPWYKEEKELLEYRELTREELPSRYEYGATFQTFTLNTPLYLKHLANNLRSNGVPIIKFRVSSLNELYNLPLFGKVNLVINSSGLGSKSLLGVKDLNCFPIKGQTILVKAPDVKTCYSFKDLSSSSDNNSTNNNHNGLSTYIIPRPGNENHCILGGLFLLNNWSTDINFNIQNEILKNCYKLCPLLDNKKGKGCIKDINIISHNIGLRPARKNGLRCELNEYNLSSSSSSSNSKEDENILLLPEKGKLDTKDGRNSRKVHVIHAYGIGPAGYQASLGISKEVGELVDQWLEITKSENKAKL
ncbi:uncharacterized protein L201_008083 [Kwoniella dendrophila CBS 6074]|uniref:FAD dependent oxidoreductase domain-containing protein n=1 Tax=Kwoniella dendrophila CBS 6074 TaxID=1295534 RepID=A0AAX4K603_9TREE